MRGAVRGPMPKGDSHPNGVHHMDSTKAQMLFMKYSPAMAYVAVVDERGTESLGSAFHVGDGIFVTARHVVEGKEIREVKLTEPVGVPTREAMPAAPTDYDEIMKEKLGFTPLWKHYQEPREISVGPVYHDDSRIDVAAFSVTGLHPRTPTIPLGTHLDDWVYRQNWVLTEAIVLGYPPIPFTLGPELVGVRAEVNAVVVLHDAPKVHFIVSAIPRGGFSGGLVLSEGDFVLGVVTRSLMMNYSATELGFFAVLSVEAIYECLARHKLLPECQRGAWEDSWNTTTTSFLERGSTGGGRQVAYISIYDDGRRLYLQVWAEEDGLLARAIAIARNSLGAGTFLEELQKNGAVRFILGEYKNEHVVRVADAAMQVEEIFERDGLHKLATLSP